MRLRSRLIQFARQVSKRPFFAKAIRWMIVNLNSLFLGDKIYETDHLFVVRHPKPAYPIHYLILPKEQIAAAVEIEPDSLFWYDVPGAIKALVKEFIPQGTGYRIITNGGAYQDIPLLHIHFISGENHE